MTRITRRTLGAGMLGAPFLPRAARAQWAPTRPIRLIAPYPPGVPVLAPGERITAAAVASLQAAALAGTRIAYAADPTLATFRVVA